MELYRAVDKELEGFLTPWKDFLLGSVREGVEISISDSVFRRLTPPKTDRPSPESRCFNGLVELRKDPLYFLLLDLLRATSLRNAISFPPGGVMHWHTNSDAPGRRTYYIFNEVGGSLFAYMDEFGTAHYEEEPEGWIVRGFTIPDPKDRFFWHAVWAKGGRVSIGFKLEEEM